MAAQAGVSEHRVRQLWRDALRHAATVAKAESPAYWQAAMARLRRLLAIEMAAEDRNSLGWRAVARWQANWLNGPLVWFDTLSLAGERGWRSLALLSGPVAGRQEIGV
jgi:hypothetical protein